MPQYRNIHPLFLELVSAAIWNKPLKADMFANLTLKNWYSLIELAAHQGVIALVADKIVSLPSKLLPSREYVAYLLLQVQEVKDDNLLHQKLIQQLHTDFEAQNILSVLVKGQANAICYPNPLLRSTGDIDLLIPVAEDYAKANDWAKKMGYPFSTEIIHHQAYFIEGINVEHHKYLSYFSRKKYDTRIREIVSNCIKNNDWCEVEINGILIKTLPVELNGVYIFMHLFNHFIHLGVGVRQLLDWLLFLKKNKENIDIEKFNSEAVMFDLLHPMKIFAKAAIKYLHTPPEIFPFSINVSDKYSDALITDMINGGNFGNKRLKEDKTLSSWRLSWQKYTIALRRSIRFFGISPKHIGLIPVTKLFMKLAVERKKASAELPK